MRRMRTSQGTHTKLSQRHESCGIGVRNFVAGGPTRKEPMRRPHAQATTIDPTPEGVGKQKQRHDGTHRGTCGWMVLRRSRNTTKRKKDGWDRKCDAIVSYTGFEHLSKTVSLPSLQISTALYPYGPGVSGVVVRCGNVIWSTTIEDRDNRGTGRYYT